MYTVSMNTANLFSVGVDVQDTRYFMCILNEEGKYPKYVQARTDTPKGQQKFFSKLPDRSKIIMPSSSFSSLVYRQLGDDMVVIKSEELYYSIWEKAGIERGRKMARFAARILFDLNGETKLSDQEIKQMLAQQQDELEQIQSIGNSCQEIITKVLDETADSSDVSRALNNLKQSQVPKLEKSKDGKQASFDEDDTSFLADLYRFIRSLQ